MIKKQERHQQQQRKQQQHPAMQQYPKQKQPQWKQSEERQLYLLRTSLKAHDFYFVPSTAAGRTAKEDYDFSLGGSIREVGDSDGGYYDSGKDDNGGRIMNDATHTLQRCFLHHANSDTDIDTITTAADTDTDTDTATPTTTYHATNNTNNTTNTTTTTSTTTWWTSLLSKQDPYLRYLIHFEKEKQEQKFQEKKTG